MKVPILNRSKNEESLIGSVLKQVLDQEFTELYEMVVMDSGSPN